MPKHGFLTPKAIANRIKAKGLQKLRWYCEMCQKQCRDENGFKCHTMSESHQRQLLLFAENPDKYIDHFSEEFKDSFTELLRRRFGTKRVHANQVYQEYVADRYHTHMNATQWETLTDFVKWLGREGLCIVDQTEKGWFITYIDRDPEAIQRKEALAKKDKMEKDNEERMAKFLQKQIDKGKDQIKSASDITYTECKERQEDEKIEFTFKSEVKAKTEALKTQNPLSKAHSSKNEGPSANQATNERSSSKQSTNERKRVSALEELMEEQETSKEKINRKDYWLAPDIVVKIITKKLGDKYYKKKCIVQEVKDKYVGIVKVIDSGDIIKLDQAHLETVIPGVGRKVQIVNGAYRGHEAVLVNIQPEKFCVKIEINSGVLRGRIVDGVRYEDISKSSS